MAKAKQPKKAKLDPWKQLGRLIKRYVEAAIADSWKGGGDPEDYETLELRFRLAHVELVSHIEKMKREYES